MTPRLYSASGSPLVAAAIRRFIGYSWQFRIAVGSASIWPVARETDIRTNGARAPALQSIGINIERPATRHRIDNRLFYLSNIWRLRPPDRARSHRRARHRGLRGPPLGNLAVFEREDAVHTPRQLEIVRRD